MGWTGRELTIPVGMVFRKMYCHKCGVKLKKEKITDTYKKGEEEYSNRILGHATIGMTQLKKSHFIYRCPNCNSSITYDEQCVVAKQQKKLKKKILKEDN